MTRTWGEFLDLVLWGHPYCLFLWKLQRLNYSSSTKETLDPRTLENTLCTVFPSSAATNILQDILHKARPLRQWLYRKWLRLTQELEQKTLPGSCLCSRPSISDSCYRTQWRVRRFLKACLQIGTNSKKDKKTIGSPLSYRTVRLLNEMRYLLYRLYSWLYRLCRL